MMPNSKLVISLLLTGSALTGCMHLSQTPLQAEKNTYHLNQQQCPADLNIAVGETIKFIAEDNPSTGYSWKLRSALQNFTATTTYKAHETKGYLIVGVGGVRTFNFTATSVGTENIHLVYTQSWEPNKVAAEWTCKVTVQ